MGVSDAIMKHAKKIVIYPPIYNPKSIGTKNLESASRDLGRDKNLVHNNLMGASQSNESKAFWAAMMTRHKHLTNLELVRQYNEKKEQKLKAFATYLLLAWLLTNVLFFVVVNMITNISWEVCDYDGASAYAQQVKNVLDSSSTDATKMMAAMGSVLFAASAILTESGTSATWLRGFLKSCCLSCLQTGGVHVSHSCCNTP